MIFDGSMVVEEGHAGVGRCNEGGGLPGRYKASWALYWKWAPTGVTEWWECLARTYYVGRVRILERRGVHLHSC